MVTCGYATQKGTPCTVDTSKGPCRFHAAKKTSVRKVGSPKGSRNLKTKTSEDKPKRSISKEDKPKRSISKEDKPKRPKGRPKGSTNKPKEDKPKRPKGRPKGSTNKPKEDKPERFRGRTRKSFSESVDMTETETVETTETSEETSSELSESSELDQSVSKIVKAKVKSKSRSKKDCILGVKKLHDYQILSVDFIRKNKALIAWWMTGSGKTLLAVAASRCYLADNPGAIVIFVSGLTLQGNFEKELKSEKVDMKTVVKAQKADGFKALKRAHKNGTKYVLIQFTQTLIDFVHTLKKMKGLKFMLIMDEAHDARNVIGQKSKALYTMSKLADKRLFLSATLIYNEPYDMEALLSLAEARKPMSKQLFAHLSTDKEKLKKYLRCVVSIQDGERNPKDYPSSTEHDVYIDMPPAFLEVYRAAEKSFETDPLFSKTRQALNVTLKGVENPKVGWIVNKITEGAKGKPEKVKKTLIYSAFIANGIDQIKAKLTKLRIPFVEIQGKVSIEERTKAVEDFNTGKIKVFFITKAGGQGLDLKGVRNVIHFESDWTRSGEEQVFGRAVRYLSHVHLPEKERHVDIYHLILRKPKELLEPGEREKTPDEYLFELKERKRKELERYKSLVRSFAIENDKKCL